MTTADEYRLFAWECLEWAEEAATDGERQSFLDMARDWTLAAFRLDGVLSTGQDRRQPAETPPP